MPPPEPSSTAAPTAGRSSPQVAASSSTAGGGHHHASSNKTNGTNPPSASPFSDLKEVDPATSFLLQLTSAGPQVQSAFPLDPTKRLLDPDQEKWFIQYISKDLLNLETVAGHATSSSSYSNGGGIPTMHPEDTNSVHTLEGSPTGGNGGAYGGGGQASPLSAAGSGNLQWIKVSELPQLGIAAVTLYFIMYDFDEAKHCFAAVLVIPNVSTYKGALSAICDRLKKIHTRVTNIFHGDDGVDDEVEASMNTQRAAAAVSPGSMGGGGVSASLGEDDTNSSRGGDHHETNSQAVDSDHHPGSTTSSSASHVFNNITRGSNNHNNSAHAIRLSSEQWRSDRDYYNNVNYCGVGSAEEAEYHEMWGWELTAAARDVGFWVRGALNRNEISLQDTVFGHTYFSIACATSYRTARDCFHFIITLALSEHQVIIRGSDARAVNEWLSTIAMFVQDDKLSMASRKCFDDFVIPDLNLQGTALERKEIVKRLLWFQSLTCIIDLDGFVHGGWSAVLKKLQSRMQRQHGMMMNNDRFAGDAMSFATTSASMSNIPNNNDNVRQTAGGGGVSFTSTTSSNPHHLLLNAVNGSDYANNNNNNVSSTPRPPAVSAPGGGVGPGQAPMGGASFFLSQDHYFSGLCVYAPARDGRRKKYSSFKDWREKQVKLRAYLQPSDFMSRSVNFKSVTSTLVDTICARVIKVAENNCHVLLRESYGDLKEKEARDLATTTTASNHAAAAALADAAGTIASPQSPSASTLPPTLPPPNPFPLKTKVWSVDDELEHTTASIRFSLDQWRRTIMLRALSFYVYEEEFKTNVPERDLQMLVERKRGPDALRLSDGDHHLMLATVEPIASVGATINDRVQKALADNLKF